MPSGRKGTSGEKPCMLAKTKFASILTVFDIMPIIDETDIKTQIADVLICFAVSFRCQPTTAAGLIKGK